MSSRAVAPTNVLTFHTVHWYARERAKKRLEQLFDEMRAIQAVLEPLEEPLEEPPAGTPKRASELRLCK